ncbi:hypothetical protein SAMN05421676_105225 [Salinibacillus kushneri]|uniref:ABC-2 type transport system permease protein n=1 Tax=Salinibacillus kushneri TaxID=237682 RepID=A0A1I0F8Q7_9BACI|nr:transporter [Salinibacillus kushneri]SET53670.1 hypothetical protein SAMN05421676_105225 [Salinibacillus kushneri]
MVKDAVWLAAKEYKQHFIPVIFTFLASIVLGLIIGSYLAKPDHFIIKFNATPLTPFVIDFILIGTAPAFSTLFMSKPYLSYNSAKHNPYVKRMAVLRSLPIRLSVLALSRTIFMLMTLLTMSIAYLGTIAFIVITFPDHFFQLLTAGEFFTFIIVWFGFILTIGGMNPYIEYGTNGKTLHFMPFIYIGILFMVEIMFYQFFNQGILEIISELVEKIGWPIGALSIIIGIIGCYGWNKLLEYRLANKDYM